MKQLSILLIGCIFCSCAMLHPEQIHKTWFVKDGKHSAHETMRPDTCRKHDLVSVSWRWRKDADTTSKIITVKN